MFTRMCKHNMLMLLKNFRGKSLELTTCLGYLNR